jgi:hypothetical protein
MPLNRRWKPNPYLSLPTKLNSKWIKDRNVRHKALKVLEENTSSYSHRNFFLNRTAKVQEMITRTDRGACIKFKLFFSTGKSREYSGSNRHTQGHP